MSPRLNAYTITHFYNLASLSSKILCPKGKLNVAVCFIVLVILVFVVAIVVVVFVKFLFFLVFFFFFSFVFLLLCFYFSCVNYCVFVLPFFPSWLCLRSLCELALVFCCHGLLEKEAQTVALNNLQNIPKQVAHAPQKRSEGVRRSSRRSCGKVATCYQDPRSKILFVDLSKSPNSKIHLAFCHLQLQAAQGLLGVTRPVRSL